MSVEIGTEAAQFPEKEYINGIFVALHCMLFSGDPSLLSFLSMFSSLFHSTAASFEPG
jgi:hypothetical protein